VQCEQHKLAKMAIERLRALPNAEVRFSARVDGLEQFDDRVEASLRPKPAARLLPAAI
jgi:3-(3-hydroxy-phenyl)propionate hydroxylase